MKNWYVKQAGQGGIVRHEIPPFFTARWITGSDPDEISSIEGPLWSDPGSGNGEDAICIFGFEWDENPGQVRFEELMREAVRAIDNFIARSL